MSSWVHLPFSLEYEFGHYFELVLFPIEIFCQYITLIHVPHRLSFGYL